MSLVSYSYGEQLVYLAALIDKDNRTLGYDTQMLLSIAESVKAARDHNLNCQRP